MQLAKGSAEDLPSGLAANFRAFGFGVRISDESIQRMGLKKTCACLRRGEAEPTCIKTSTRLIANTKKIISFLTDFLSRFYNDRLL